MRKNTAFRNPTNDAGRKLVHGSNAVDDVGEAILYVIENDLKKVI